MYPFWDFVSSGSDEYLAFANPVNVFVVFLGKKSPRSVVPFRYPKTLLSCSNVGWLAGCYALPEE